MQVSTINKTTFGYKLGNGFSNALQNQNYLYDISSDRRGQLEKYRYNQLVEEIELNGPTQTLDINEKGMITLDNKEIASSSYTYIGNVIGYKTLKNVYEKLFNTNKI